MDDCIFCKLGAAEDGKFIYRDDYVFAIPDIFPSSKGHTLVIPRAHMANILDAPDDTVSKLFSLAKRIALKQTSALKADGIKISTNSGSAQDVFHFHIHVKPVYSKPPQGFEANRAMTPSEQEEIASLLKIQ
ncbi:MAG: HIT domain-containing protein [Candidatus Micrarchaeota archaeon]|nr:HIT domain-containing protein [Candidatus Micrarchaeota archaeon]